MDSVEALRRELSRYRETEVEIASCREQVRELNAALSGCIESGEQLSDAGMKSYTDAIERVTGELMRRMGDALSIRREVSSRIDAAELTPEDRALLEMRFLARMSWESIADALGYADARSARRRTRTILARMGGGASDSNERME